MDNTATATRTAWLARLALLLAMALLLGTMLALGADARTVAAGGLSIKTRVHSQMDVCLDGGGNFATERNAATGSVSTKCSGGTQDGTHCINTTKVTDCHIDRVAPPSGDVASGVSGDLGGRLGSVQVDAGGPSAVTAPAPPAHHTHHEPKRGKR
jgi:hypothetical protein